MRTLVNLLSFAGGLFLISAVAASMNANAADVDGNADMNDLYYLIVAVTCFVVAFKGYQAGVTR